MALSLAKSYSNAVTIPFTYTANNFYGNCI